MLAKKIPINGVGIQVEDHGGSSTPVLFMHYGGANLRMWDPVVSHIQDRFRCITLDLRAHGQSDAPSTGYRIDDFANDVAGVLDALEVPNAHVVGCSIGAEVGLSLAANHPEKVLSLVADGALASEYGQYGVREHASLDEDTEMLEKLRAMVERPENVYETREALVEATAAMYEGSGYWNEWLEAVTAYGAIEMDDGTFVNAWRKWARDEYMRGYFRIQVEAYYPRVKCPVLMLPDEDTKADETQFDIVQRLSKLPEECEIAVVPGSDHPFGWMLIPEAMASAVLGFVTKVDASTATPPS